MIDDNIIPEIRLTPVFKTLPCKISAYLLSYALKFGALLSGALVWILYDYFFAIATLLLSFVVMGIIRSKLLHISIPPAQQEHNYSDLQIAHWFLFKRYCFESNDTPSNIKVL